MKLDRMNGMKRTDYCGTLTADKIGADKYAKDAMESVRYAEEIINGGKE